MDALEFRACLTHRNRIVSEGAGARRPDARPLAPLTASADRAPTVAGKPVASAGGPSHAPPMASPPDIRRTLLEDEALRRRGVALVVDQLLARPLGDLVDAASTMSLQVIHRAQEEALGQPERRIPPAMCWSYQPVAEP